MDIENDVNLFAGDTADEVWGMAAKKVFASAEKRGLQQSRIGDTFELMHCHMVIRDPKQRFLFRRTPPLNIAFAHAEVVWILAGRNDLQLPTFFNSRYPDFVGRNEQVHGAYGFRLRSHFGIDQLERAAESLAGSPSSRQVVLQIWDAASDMPHLEGRPASQDIPCNVLSMLKVREGRLEWTQILRSNDLFLGVPHNFIQFTSLQEVLAGWIGIKVGNYTHFADSLHAYLKDVGVFGVKSETANCQNVDSLQMPLSQFRRCFAELVERTDTMIKCTCVKTVQDAAVWNHAPVGFANIARTLGAYALRKHKACDAAEEVMKECQNPALSFAWRQWVEYRSSRY